MTEVITKIAIFLFGAAASLATVIFAVKAFGAEVLRLGYAVPALIFLFLAYMAFESLGAFEGQSHF